MRPSRSNAHIDKNSKPSIEDCPLPAALPSTRDLRLDPAKALAVTPAFRVLLAIALLRSISSAGLSDPQTVAFHARFRSLIVRAFNNFPLTLIRLRRVTTPVLRTTGISQPRRRLPSSSTLRTPLLPRAARLRRSTTPLSLRLAANRMRPRSPPRLLGRILSLSRSRSFLRIC